MWRGLVWLSPILCLCEQRGRSQLPVPTRIRNYRWWNRMQRSVSLFSNLANSKNCFNIFSTEDKPCWDTKTRKSGVRFFPVELSNRKCTLLSSTFRYLFVGQNFLVFSLDVRHASNLSYTEFCLRSDIFAKKSESGLYWIFLWTPYDIQSVIDLHLMIQLV